MEWTNETVRLQYLIELACAVGRVLIDGDNTVQFGSGPIVRCNPIEITFDESFARDFTSLHRLVDLIDSRLHQFERVRHGIPLICLPVPAYRYAYNRAV